MSILLEALRKSEKGQRSREVPTIHTEVPGDAPFESRQTLPIVLLIMIALIICGWFVWNQYWVPADENIVTGDGTELSGTDQPSAGLTVSESKAQAPESSEENGQAQPVVAANDVTATNNPPAVAANTVTAVNNSPAVAANNVTDANNSSAVSTNNQSGEKTTRPRTPTESYQPPPEIAAELTAASTTDEPQKADSTNPVATSKGIVVPDSAVTAKADVSSTGSESQASTATKASGQEDKPRAIEPIGYWELPDSAREVVPMIKYSVLVYNKNPPDRFVLVNGQRLREGDSLQPGVEVKEIRRDGVIFSYRLYRFIVER